MGVTETRNTVLIKRPLVEIKEEATLVITEQFLNQLKYICSKISEVEWSGLVFFTVEGEPTDLENFKLFPYYIHIMDKGTSGYTEFDDDGSAVELYKLMPELDPFEGNGYRYGKIHSHNTMNVFHSAVDVQDLQDQAEAYQEYYLSIIVNNFMDVEAKMAFVAEIPDQQINPKGFKGAKWQLPKKDVLVTVDFDIELEGVDLTIPVALKERVEEITTYTPPVHRPLGYQRNLPVSSHALNHNLNNNFGVDDTEDDYNGYGEFDYANYRVTQGMTIIRTFLHEYYDDKVSTPDVFEYTCELPLPEIEKIKKALGPWFDKLQDWSKQNVLLYITDVKIEINEQNLEQLYEVIWEKIKTIPEA